MFTVKIILKRINRVFRSVWRSPYRIHPLKISTVTQYVKLFYTIRQYVVCIIVSISGQRSFGFPVDWCTTLQVLCHLCSGRSNVALLFCTLSARILSPNTAVTVQYYWLIPQIYRTYITIILLLPILAALSPCMYVCTIIIYKHIYSAV